MGMFEIPEKYESLTKFTEEILSKIADDELIYFIEIPYKQTEFRDLVDKEYGIWTGSRYKFLHDKYGNIGELEIRKKDEKISIVSFGNTPNHILGSRKPTDQELLDIESAVSKQDRLIIYLNVQKTIREEALNLYEKRKETLAEIRSAYFESLVTKVITRVKSSIFRQKKNGKWEIIFAGVRAKEDLPDLDGLHFIRELLRKQYWGFTGLELYVDIKGERHVEGHPLPYFKTIKDANEAMDIEPDEEDYVLHYDTGSYEEIFTGHDKFLEWVKEQENIKKDLEREILLTDDPAELLELRTKIENINSSIEDEWNKRQGTSSDRKYHKVLVKRAIKRAYNVIREHVPELVEYLETAIETKRKFTYLPNRSNKYLPIESEDWILY